MMTGIEASRLVWGPKGLANSGRQASFHSSVADHRVRIASQLAIPAVR